MVISDELYALLAKRVYWVQADRSDVEYHPEEGEKYYYDIDKKSLGRFQVLKVKDNLDNGMQAMAVAPVDKKGHVDTSQVVIAYAGTNFQDPKDVDTDLQTIGLGRTETIKTYKRPPLLPLPLPFTGHQVASQAKTALTFAQELAQTYPDAHFTTTGHSLGQSLAMYVALKQNYQNVDYWKKLK